MIHPSMKYSFLLAQIMILFVVSDVRDIIVSYIYQIQLLNFLLVNLLVQLILK